ncbi:MAG: hypothetical protein NZ853_05785 [Leptospiraceae bacterium]|nr:hypothetical protein [Leptospiraceae bacterium]MDW7976540.1 hypothetical protein [Leptospiraceae bacterium]
MDWNRPKLWKEIQKAFLEHKLQRYMIEFDTVSLETKINKIRQKIFGEQEFLELKDKVLFHQPQSYLNKVSFYEKKYFFDKFFRKEILDFLKKKYSEDFEFFLLLSLEKNFFALNQKLHEYLKKDFNYLDGLVILASNEFSYGYFPLLAFNVDEETKKNLYINFDDDLFPMNEITKIQDDMLEFVKITNELLLNPFFTKRFSSEILKSIQRLILFKKVYGSIEFVLVCFFGSQENLENFIKSNSIERLNVFLDLMYDKLTFYSYVFTFYSLKFMKRKIFLLIMNQIKVVSNKFNEAVIVEIEFQQDPDNLKTLIEDIKIFQKKFENQKDYTLMRVRFKKLFIIFRNHEVYHKHFHQILNEIKQTIRHSLKVNYKIISPKEWTYVNF